MNVNNNKELNMTLSEKICADRQSGMTWKELMSKYTVSQQTLYRILFKAGLTSETGSRTKLTDEQREQVCEDYRNGMTYMKLSAKYGVCPPVINRIVRSAGLVGTRKKV